MVSKVELKVTVSLDGSSAALDAAALDVLRELIATELAHDLELVTASVTSRTCGTLSVSRVGSLGPQLRAYSRRLRCVPRRFAESSSEQVVLVTVATRSTFAAAVARILNIFASSGRLVNLLLASQVRGTRDRQRVAHA